MSYLVLARKYRPTAFSELIGQPHVVRTIGNAMELDRLHHAFVFAGARGVGKTTCARLLARAINCGEGPRVTPCGRCGPCRQQADQASADVLEIDGASHTGVDSVRELRETVRYLPAQGRFKVYIIDEVHMLSQAAFNALLKTLEEPPRHVKFILATTEPHKIPATILSRCQRLDFRRVDVAALAGHLRDVLAREQLSASEALVQAIAAGADGSVRDALSLLDQALSFRGDDASEREVLEALGMIDRRDVARLAGFVLAGDGAQVLATVADLDGRGHELGRVAVLVAEHLRDVAVVGCLGHPPREASGGGADPQLLAAQAQGHDADGLGRLFRAALAVAEDVARSPIPRMSLEMGLLRMLALPTGVATRTLIERVDRLLAGAAGPESPAAAAQPASAGPGAAAGAAPPLEPAAGRPAAPGPPPARERPAAAGSGGSDSGPGSDTDAGSDRDAGKAATGGDRPANEASWAAYVRALREHNPMVASLLDHGRVLDLGPKEVTVALPRPSFYWDRLSDRRIAAIAEQALAAHLGRPATIVLVPLTDPAMGSASLAEQASADAQQEAASLEQRARTHPAVASAAGLLGGEVTHVRPLAAATVLPAP